MSNYDWSMAGLRVNVKLAYSYRESIGTSSPKITTYKIFTTVCT